MYSQNGPFHASHKPFYKILSKSDTGDHLSMVIRDSLLTLKTSFAEHGISQLASWASVLQ
jgi:hypothetical protein